MTLAIFDLDNTLIGGDSDNLWGQYLFDHGLVEAADFARQNDQFYEDYKSGNLDIDAYLRFALAPLKNQPVEVLQDWHTDFMRKVIEPIMLPKALSLIAEHRALGHTLIIITATNVFITRPIANALGIDHLLACEAETIDGRYTGKPIGVPSYREGKVVRLAAWLKQTGESFSGAYFYSDSHHDLPLLEKVAHPVAVDPDPTLRRRAQQKNWKILSLRD
ncbi:MAG: HAD superfamily hydrolase (TIGR01490 family) [Halioglobus sp.]|jgi:HAD superfamily hydrolase (TIGR01490 family)